MWVSLVGNLEQIKLIVNYIFLRKIYFVVFINIYFKNK